MKLTSVVLRFWAWLRSLFVSDRSKPEIPAPLALPKATKRDRTRKEIEIRARRFGRKLAKMEARPRHIVKPFTLGRDRRGNQG